MIEIKKNDVNTIFEYGKFLFLEPHLVKSVNDRIIYRNKFPLENSNEELTHAKELSDMWNQIKEYTLLIGMPKYYTETGKLIRNNEAYAETGAPMYKSNKHYDTKNLNEDIPSKLCEG